MAMVVNGKGLSNLKSSELLVLYSDILKELADRKVVRSFNNPVAGIGEYLAATALGLKLAPLSTKGYNATGTDGRRYEIKSRRLTPDNSSRMLSALRDCKSGHFHFLVGVLYSQEFSVYKACLVPHKVVLERAIFKEHVNAHILELEDNLWKCDGVVDLTKQIRAIAERL